MKKICSLLLICLMIISPLSGVLVYGAEMDALELNYLKRVIAERYVDPITVKDLKGNTPEEIFQNLDKHSVYFDPETFEQLLNHMGGSFVGIGAYVQRVEDRIIITEPIEGSPAEKAGVLAGDEVLEIDGLSMKGLTLDEAVALMRGPIGSQVIFTIYRSLTGETLTLTITRDEIYMKTVVQRVIDGIGYIEISSFSDHTYQEFINAASSLYRQGIKKLIIDLRDNGGGLLDTAVAICRLLVPKGPIVHVEYRQWSESYYSDLVSPLFTDIAVLVNENSASASEIMAAALQDTGVGTIIGNTTYGKGSVQRVYYLNSGGGFKLTEARYLSPNKRIIDGVGVTPDIEVDRFPETLDWDALLALSTEQEMSIHQQGEESLAVQQRLQILGYLGEITDPYRLNDAVLEALKTFAQEQGFTFDGEVLSIELLKALDMAFVDAILGDAYDQQLQAALAYLQGSEGFVAFFPFHLDSLYSHGIN